MSSSLSDIVDNLAEWINWIKSKYRLDKKIWKIEIKYKDCEWYFEYTYIKEDLLISKSI